MLAVSLLVVFLTLLLLYSRHNSLATRRFDLRAVTLPSPEVVERVFSDADARYAATLPEAVRRRFVRDRRALAITWIRQIRDLAIRLSREHVRTVRRNPALTFGKEWGIAVSFVYLLVSCELLAVLVSAFGPVRARTVVGKVLNSFDALQAKLQTGQLVAYNPA